MECELCGGRGFTIVLGTGKTKRKPCKCRAVRDFHDKIEPVDVPDFVLKSKVPSRYFQLIEFDTEELKEQIEIPDHLKDIAVDVYVDTLDSYVRAVRLGKRPEKSYFVVAPPGSGKKIFVYTAIKQALRGGLNPSGLLDTHDIYELMEAKKFGKIKELLMVDIAFLTMGGSPAKSDVIALRAMIDICERFGVPLVVVSRFSAEFLAKNDPMLIADVGVRVTKRGDYGRLEHVGFTDDFMNRYRDNLKGANGLSRAKPESAADYKERVRRETGEE